MYLDGKRLRMSNGETEQEHILALESGELMLLWQLHRPDVGQAVEITSGARALPAFHACAGATAPPAVYTHAPMLCILCLLPFLACTCAPDALRCTHTRRSSHGLVSRPAHLPSLSAAMPGRAVPLLTPTLTCCCADMLSVTVFVTPAGTRDAGGVLQPAYLNFDAQLLGPPAPGMKVCAAPLHHPSHAAHLPTLPPATRAGQFPALSVSFLLW